MDCLPGEDHLEEVDEVAVFGYGVGFRGVDCEEAVSAPHPVELLEAAPGGLIGEVGEGQPEGPDARLPER